VGFCCSPVLRFCRPGPPSGAMAPSAQLKGVIRMQQGTKVEVHGLEKRTELNGLIGECLQFDAAKMRWGVQLPDGSKILLKMTNLRPIDAEVSEAVQVAGEPPKAAELGADGGAPEAEAEDVPRETEEAAGDAAPPAEEAPALDAEGGAPAPEGAGAGELSEEAFPHLPQMPDMKQAPRTGRWWLNESAAIGFAEQLRANDPSLVSLCLVPPKRFNESDVEQISGALEGNEHCHELLASGHSLNELSCQRLARCLRLNKSLKTLSLGDSTLGDRASILFDGLARNTSITSLDLEHKGLTADALRRLAGALSQRRDLGAPAMECLRLSRNVRIVDALEALLSTAAPKQLLLCECGLNARHGDALGRWCAGGVEELDLRGNSSFASEGLEGFLAALELGTGPRGGYLRRLRLTGCSVGDDGAEALAKAFRLGLDLEELSLEACEVTIAGCEVLARALAGSRLSRLSMRANDLGDDGCRALAACSEGLDMSATDMGPRGLEALARQPLTSVELFNCPKLGMSVGEWCSAMSSADWQELRHFDMSCCGLGNEGFRTLCCKLTENPDLMPKLETLCLGGNDVDDSEEAASHAIDEKLVESRGGRLRLIWRNG